VNHKDEDKKNNRREDYRENSREEKEKSKENALPLLCALCLISTVNLFSSSSVQFFYPGERSPV
jgi:hypothetical protein